MSCLIRPENAIFIFKRFGVKMKKFIEKQRIFIALRIYRPYQEELSDGTYRESLLPLVLPSITKCSLVDERQVEDVTLAISSTS
jgi:hypothetical protein